VEGDRLERPPLHLGQVGSGLAVEVQEGAEQRREGEGGGIVEPVPVCQRLDRASATVRDVDLGEGAHQRRKAGRTRVVGGADADVGDSEVGSDHVSDHSMRVVDDEGRADLLEVAEDVLGVAAGEADVAAGSRDRLAVGAFDRIPREEVFEGASGALDVGLEPPVREHVSGDPLAGKPGDEREKRVEVPLLRHREEGRGRLGHPGAP
jgi:hypothetical protein